MPYRRLPNSFASVLRTLKNARDEYKNTPEAAERAISAEQFAWLTDTGSPESFLTRFERECSDVDRALAAQVPLSDDLSRKAAQATMFVSHFHQVFDLGVARGRFQAGAHLYYGRDASATKGPALGSYEEVKEAADAIAQGEADRAAAEGAGFVPMSNPSAEEVLAVVAAFGEARTAAKNASKKTDKEREDAGAMYPEAQAKAVDLCDSVEFFYRNDPSASSRRTKCRRWGVVYVFGEGETPDPNPGPGGGGGNPTQG
jgi:hypothetical protein